MRVIGVMGGVGSGKSEILGFLEKNYNCRVVQADIVARRLMEPGGACYGDVRGLVEHSGLLLFLPDASFNRPALARLMFESPELREEINDVVHPAVKEYVQNEIERERELGKIYYFVLEAALLIEGGLDGLCDELWYIYTSVENRRARLKASRGYSDEKIDSIIRSQLPEKTFRERSSLVIDNNKAPEHAFSQIRKYLGEN